MLHGALLGDVGRLAPDHDAEFRLVVDLVVPGRQDHGHARADDAAGELAEDEGPLRHAEAALIGVVLVVQPDADDLPGGEGWAPAAPPRPPARPRLDSASAPTRSASSSTPGAPPRGRVRPGVGPVERPGGDRQPGTAVVEVEDQVALREERAGDQRPGAGTASSRTKVMNFIDRCPVSVSERGGVNRVLGEGLSFSSRPTPLLGQLVVVDHVDGLVPDPLDGLQQFSLSGRASPLPAGRGACRGRWCAGRSADRALRRARRPRATRRSP